MELELRGKVTKVQDREYMSRGEPRSETNLTVLNSSGTDIVRVKWTDFSKGAAPVEGDDVHLAVTVRLVTPKPDAANQFAPFLAVEAAGRVEADAVPAPPRAVRSAG